MKINRILLSAISIFFMLYVNNAKSYLNDADMNKILKILDRNSGTYNPETTDKIMKIMAPNAIISATEYIDKQKNRKANNRSFKIKKKLSKKNTKSIKKIKSSTKRISNRSKLKSRIVSSYHKRSGYNLCLGEFSSCLGQINEFSRVSGLF